MKKLSTLAAAAALAVAAAAPVAADNDPFVSTQGGFGMEAAIIGAVGLAIVIVASDGS